MMDTLLIQIYDRAEELPLEVPAFYRTQPRPRPEPRLSIREELGEENEAELSIEYLMEGVGESGPVDY